MADSETLWLARIAGPADAPWPRCLRCRSEGGRPGPDQRWEPIPDPFHAARWRGGDPVAIAGQCEALGEAIVLGAGEAKLLPPLEPSKILAIGRNYAAHARELGNEVPETPISFFKPPSCLSVSGQAVELPRGYARIDMESELVVVIGARARKVPAARAWDHVAGYLLGNDVSCRDLQKSDKQWTRAKGFDGFGPVSAFVRLVEPGWELPSEDLRIHGYLDDQRVQDGSVAAMIFSIPTLIEHLSACMTLEPGDLIFTGTPEGVSPLSPGQVARVELQGLELAPVVTPLL